MKIKSLISTVLTLFMLLPLTTSIFAVDVVLNPVQVNGSISFGGHEFNKYIAKATSDEFNATADVLFDPAVTSSNYSLTVNVEEDTTRSYYVGATFFSGNDRFYSAPKLVDVTDYSPTQATLFDIGQNEIGTVHGQIILPEGVEVQSSRVHFNFVDFNTNPYFREAGYKQLTADQLSFEMPVAANESIKIVAYITLKTGQQHTFIIDPFTVATDGTHNVTFEITPVTASGSVGGRFDLKGPVQITRYWTRIYGPGGNINKYYVPEIGTNSFDWSVDNMVSSDTTKYRQWLWASFKSQQYTVQMSIDYNAFNPSQSYYILDGQHTTVDAIANQAFLEGNLNIQGNFPFDDLVLAQIKLTSSKYGNSPAYVDLSTMSYNAMGLDVGEWGIAYAKFNLNGEGNTHREIIEYYPYATYSSQALTPDEPKHQDLDIAMGSVTVKFSVTDGQRLSTPRIITPNQQTWCTYYNDQGAIIHRWRTNSYVNDQIDVLEGEVTFHGPDALCQGLKAEALVAGSWTTFGYIDVEVISGVDVVIDIGGPTLTVDVAPGSFVETEIIVVTGTATDDTEVSTVTVNGVNATLTTTNNPDDPHEVNFVASVTLTKGENTLKTIATDSSDKQSSDTRTVFYDSAVPTLNFTPDDGTEVVVPTTSITVVGTTSDDVDIKSVTINGSAVSLIKIADASYSFTANITLDQCDSNYPCSTNLVVISTDTSGRTTTEIHTITLKDDQQDTSAPVLFVDVVDGSYVTTEQLLVTGNVTDDVGVTSVVINGISATLNPIDGTADENDRSFSATINLVAGSNEIITIATDAAGNQSTEKRTVIYDGADPELSFTPSDGSVVNNVTSVTVSGTAFDASEISSVTINGSTAQLVDEGDGNYSFSFEMTLLQCGLAPCDTVLTVVATDTSGRSTSKSQTVTLLTNLPPKISSLSIAPDVISVGDSVFAQANFSDPNADDSHTAVWDWGDSSTETSCTTADNQNCSVTDSNLSASHTYLIPGIYTVTVTLTDEQGEIDSISYEHVIVFDENDGFVTGGGWITSPAGAYVADQYLTGTANFGFVAKYKKGASVPTGNTEFQFQIGNINFHTNNFEWLIINESKATFSGKGSLNGISDYSILITVVDARQSAETGVDLFKVTIKDPMGEIIYDTFNLTPISSGSIVVHNKK